jgi:hypothetical protein
VGSIMKQISAMTDAVRALIENGGRSRKIEGLASDYFPELARSRATRVLTGCEVA